MAAPQAHGPPAPSTSNARYAPPPSADAGGLVNLALAAQLFQDDDDDDMASRDYAGGSSRPRTLGYDDDDDDNDDDDDDRTISDPGDAVPAPLTPPLPPAAVAPASGGGGGGGGGGGIPWDDGGRATPSSSSRAMTPMLLGPSGTSELLAPRPATALGSSPTDGAPPSPLLAGGRRTPPPPDAHVRPDDEVYNMPLTTDARLPPPRTDAERAALDTFELLTESVITRPALGRAEGAGDYPCMCRYNPDADPLATACGPNAQCINRQLFVECVPGVCPVGKKCQNRRILTRQSAAVEVVQTARKGFGLRALEALPAGAFVLEYTGEVISRSMFLRRAKAYSALGHRHFYFMSLQKDEIIDAQRKGGLARFINHSCNPNCETQKWIVGSQLRIGLFTKRAVPRGAELTFDYKFERYGARAQPCFCGEPNCSGIIGASASARTATELGAVADDVEMGLSDESDLSSVSDNSGEDDDLDDDDLMETDDGPAAPSKHAALLARKRARAAGRRGRVSDHDDRNADRVARHDLDDVQLEQLMRPLLGPSGATDAPPVQGALVERILDRLLRAANASKHVLRRFVQLKGAAAMAAAVRALAAAPPPESSPTGRASTPVYPNGEVRASRHRASSTAPESGRSTPTADPAALRLRKAMQVLEMLPITTLNTVRDNGLDAAVRPLCDHDDDLVAHVARDLSDKWSALPTVYRIPKTARRASPPPPPPAAGAAAAAAAVDSPAPLSTGAAGPDAPRMPMLNGAGGPPGSGSTTRRRTRSASDDDAASTAYAVANKRYRGARDSPSTARDPRTGFPPPLPPPPQPPAVHDANAMSVALLRNPAAYGVTGALAAPPPPWLVLPVPMGYLQGGGGGGRVYYFHPPTHRTTWDAPTSSSATTTLANQATAGGYRASPAPPQQPPPLPRAAPAPAPPPAQAAKTTTTTLDDATMAEVLAKARRAAEARQAAAERAAREKKERDAAEEAARVREMAERKRAKMREMERGRRDEKERARDDKDRRDPRAGGHESARRDRDRDEPGKRDRDRDRERDRERARDKDHRHRERSRDRDRDRDRARDKDRHHDRSRSSRSRDRDRDRDRARESKDRARESERGDRARDSDRDRDRDRARDAGKDRDRPTPTAAARDRSRDRDQYRDRSRDTDRTRDRSRDSRVTVDRARGDRDRSRSRSRDRPHRHRDTSRNKDRSRPRDDRPTKDVVPRAPTVAATVDYRTGSVPRPADATPRSSAVNGPGLADRSTAILSPAAQPTPAPSSSSAAAPPHAPATPATPATPLHPAAFRSAISAAVVRQLSKFRPSSSSTHALVLPQLADDQAFKDLARACTHQILDHEPATAAKQHLVGGNGLSEKMAGKVKTYVRKRVEYVYRKAREGGGGGIGERSV